MELEHTLIGTRPVICLACGLGRASATSLPECPSCDYLGWAHSSSLTTADRAWYTSGRLGEHAAQPLFAA